MNETSQSVTLPVYIAAPYHSGEPGSGNPAAVVLCSSNQISRAQKSFIARTLAQPETVFVHPPTSAGRLWTFDWFTPEGNRLCPGGNGSIAAAKVILASLQSKDHDRNRFSFEGVTPGLGGSARLNDDGSISLTIEAIMPRQAGWEYMMRLKRSFGDGVSRILVGEQDLIMVFDSEEEVRSLAPDLSLLHAMPYRVVIATSKGDRKDFVYRSFVSGGNCWECPGSGRALMNLAIYWDTMLRSGRNALTVEQLSHRGGTASCCLIGTNEVIVTAACPVNAGPFEYQFDVVDQTDETGLLCPPCW
jgi:predicted PhzF superfamily epimerase YddE/YHI9